MVLLVKTIIVKDDEKRGFGVSRTGKRVYKMFIRGRFRAAMLFATVSSGWYNCLF